MGPSPPKATPCRRESSCRLPAAYAGSVAPAGTSQKRRLAPTRPVARTSGHGSVCAEDMPDRSRRRLGPAVMRMRSRNVAALAVAWSVAVAAVATQSSIGREVAVTGHLADGEEFSMPLHKLLARGQRLFTAAWTIQEGGGRPLTKGTGNPLTDRSTPLAFPRNFNRVSGPDANSCAGCHNLPYGLPGGGGDIVANVFVLGQRFDFATFDGNDAMPTRGV